MLCSSSQECTGTVDISIGRNEAAVAPHRSEMHPEMPAAVLEALVEQANSGSKEAQDELRKWLDATPAAWQAIGALGTRVESALRDAISGSQFLEGECIRRDMDALRTSLLAEDASVIERMLVDRVIICQLHLHLAERRLP